MKPKEILKILTKEGWEIKSQRGSHIYLAHKTKPGKLTIPNHNKDLKPGTLNSILKQAGLK
ncbi:YcfA-like protein [Clostridium liquoris]|jgi:predicted RNA binding protein YcfA (HicA-like mRNA interferase family)|uniref:YcfA-like protein n=1 Tax=Clostridium liquoris TaxID=1289519 RepID=A0A2T0B1J8_9CLOT|nr:type II toxin-antitoxin system HicA family toxin [Clostridium liquoris]PRR77677.1 YcfA-like protein [Clostridium liquoris]